MMSEFQPIVPPIEINGGFVRGKPTALRLETLSVVSGDDYIVRDFDGNIIIRAKAKEWSCRDQKKIYDSAGEQLCVIKDNILTLHNSMECEVEGVQVFKVGQYTSYTSDSTRFIATVHDAVEEKKRTIEINGNWLGRNAEMRLQPSGKDKKDSANQGQLVGKIQRANQSVAFIASNDPKSAETQEEVKTQYTAAIAPGVDLALISIIFLLARQALDSARHLDISTTTVFTTTTTTRAIFEMFRVGIGIPPVRTVVRLLAHSSSASTASSQTSDSDNWSYSLLSDPDSGLDDFDDCGHEYRSDFEPDWKLSPGAKRSATSAYDSIAFGAQSDKDFVLVSKSDIGASFYLGPPVRKTRRRIRYNLDTTFTNDHYHEQEHEHEHNNDYDTSPLTPRFPVVLNAEPFPSLDDDSRSKPLTTPTTPTSPWSPQFPIVLNTGTDGQVARRVARPTAPWPRFPIVLNSTPTPPLPDGVYELPVSAPPSPIPGSSFGAVLLNGPASPLPGSSFRTVVASHPPTRDTYDHPVVVINRDPRPDYVVEILPALGDIAPPAISTFEVIPEPVEVERVQLVPTAVVTPAASSASAPRQPPVRALSDIIEYEEHIAPSQAFRVVTPIPVVTSVPVTHVATAVPPAPVVLPTISKNEAKAEAPVTAVIRPEEDKVAVVKELPVVPPVSPAATEPEAAQSFSSSDTSEIESETDTKVDIEVQIPKIERVPKASPIAGRFLGLDTAAHPSILDRLICNAPYKTLLGLRTASSSVSAAVDTHLSRRVQVTADRHQSETSSVRSFGRKSSEYSLGRITGIRVYTTAGGGLHGIPATREWSMSLRNDTPRGALDNISGNAAEYVPLYAFREDETKDRKNKKKKKPATVVPIPPSLPSTRVIDVAGPVPLSGLAQLLATAPNVHSTIYSPAMGMATVASGTPHVVVHTSAGASPPVGAGTTRLVLNIGTSLNVDIPDLNSTLETLQEVVIRYTSTDSTRDKTPGLLQSSTVIAMALKAAMFRYLAPVRFVLVLSSDAEELKYALLAGIERNLTDPRSKTRKVRPLRALSAREMVQIKALIRQAVVVMTEDEYRRGVRRDEYALEVERM